MGFLLSLGFFLTLFSPPLRAESSMLLLSERIQENVCQAVVAEDDILHLKEEMAVVKKEMKTLLIQVHHQSSLTKELFHRLYHVKDIEAQSAFSKILGLSQANTIQEIVHLSLAMKSLSPAESKKFSDLIGILKKLSQVRSSLQILLQKVDQKQQEKKKFFAKLRHAFDQESQALSQAGNPLPIKYFKADEPVDQTLIPFINNLGGVPIHPSFAHLAQEKTPLVTGEKILYKSCEDQIIRSPLEGNILLVGKSAQQGSLMLMRQKDLLICLEGMDQVFKAPGQELKKNEAIAFVCASPDHPKSLKVRVWRCPPQG